MSGPVRGIATALEKANWNTVPLRVAGQCFQDAKRARPSEVQNFWNEFGHAREAYRLITGERYA